jgi:hypothetical protein
MRVRSTVAVAVLTVGISVPLAGSALAADRDCKDFPTQAAAQAALLPGDPENLDANSNGVACEDFAYSGAAAAAAATSAGQVGTRPAGAVAAGDGSSARRATDEGGSALPYVVGGLAFAAAGGAAFAARRAASA